jgi:hypothetical protein
MKPGYETLKGKRELWRGRQWAVTTYCIQGLGVWNYYFIELDRVCADVRFLGAKLNSCARPEHCRF